MWAARQEPLKTEEGVPGDREGHHGRAASRDCEQGLAARHQVRQGMKKSSCLATEAIGDPRVGHGGGGGQGEKYGHQYHLEVNSPPDLRHSMTGKRPWNS